MLNDDKLLKSGFKRCWTSRGEERCLTSRDGEGRYERRRTLKDGSVTMMKRWVTMSHDDKKTIMGRSRDGNGNGNGTKS